MTIKLTDSFHRSLDSARERFNEFADETRAAAAFKADGGNMWEIFGIERAFLGELVEIREVFDELAGSA